MPQYSKVKSSEREYQGPLSDRRNFLSLMFSSQKLKTVRDCIGLCMNGHVITKRCLGKSEFAFTFGFMITFLQNEGQKTSRAVVQTKV